jgi:hypothetical protein
MRESVFMMDADRSEEEKARQTFHREYPFKSRLYCDDLSSRVIVAGHSF